MGLRMTGCTVSRQGLIYFPIAVLDGEAAIEIAGVFGSHMPIEHNLLFACVFEIPVLIMAHAAGLLLYFGGRRTTMILCIPQ
jgi:hypothetical protein